MFPARLADEICAALADVVPTVRADVTVERPVRSERGDLASPVALRLAARAGVPPRRLAELVAERLTNVDGIASCQVEGEGFVNVVLTPEALAGIVRHLVAVGPGLASDGGASGAGRHVLPEVLTDELCRAHARLVSLLRGGAALCVDRDPARVDPGELAAGVSRQLVCALAEFPAVVERGGVRAYDRHLTELVGLLGRFEAAGRILPKGPEEPTSTHGTRLVLVDASRIVVAAGLARCGVTAPDRL